MKGEKSYFESKTTLGGLDSHAGELAETGVDSVHGLTACEYPLHSLGRRFDAGPTRLFQHRAGASINSSPLDQRDIAWLQHHGIPNVHFHLQYVSTPIACLILRGQNDELATAGEVPQLDYLDYKMPARAFMSAADRCGNMTPSFQGNIR
jgi:hypothetical protein